MCDTVRFQQSGGDTNVRYRTISAVGWRHKCAIPYDFSSRVATPYSLKSRVATQVCDTVQPQKSGSDTSMRHRTAVPLLEICKNKYKQGSRVPIYICKYNPVGLQPINQTNFFGSITRIEEINVADTKGTVCQDNCQQSYRAIAIGF